MRAVEATTGEDDVPLAVVVVGRIRGQHAEGLGSEFRADQRRNEVLDGFAGDAGGVEYVGDGAQGRRLRCVVRDEVRVHVGGSADVERLPGKIEQGSLTARSTTFEAEEIRVLAGHYPFSAPIVSPC